MKDRIIGFSFGLSEDDLEKGKNSFYAVSKEAPGLDLRDISESLLKVKVGDALLDMMANGELQSVGKQQADEKSPSAELCPYRIVIVHAQEREQVLQVMRSFKAVLSNPQDMVFAVITETALNWTFEDYIGHLGEEHECMKTRRPQ
jgi:hypothetical protein